MQELSSHARNLAVEIATERASLLEVVTKDYRTKRNRRKFAGITALIEIHCFTKVLTLEDESYEIRGVLIQQKQLYKDVFARADYPFLNKLLQQDKVACER